MSQEVQHLWGMFKTMLPFGLRKLTGSAGVQSSAPDSAQMLRPDSPLEVDRIRDGQKRGTGERGFETANRYESPAAWNRSTASHTHGTSS